MTRDSCYHPVGREMLNTVAEKVASKPRSTVTWSFYAEGVNERDIPDMFELWTDNYVEREPRVGVVTDAARRLGVKGVVMAWYKCSNNQYVSDDRYVVDVYLIDVERGATFHSERGYLDVSKAVVEVFDEFFAARGQ